VLNRIYKGLGKETDAGEKNENNKLKRKVENLVLGIH
jgi:hypothetical protein